MPDSPLVVERLWFAVSSTRVSASAGTWQYADVYNVVESDSTRYLIGCRAACRWSKCTYLIPGVEFGYEVKGGKMEIRGSKDGKKETTIKFNILGTEPR